MAFSQESFQQLNPYVSNIQLNNREQIPGCRRYCVYFRNFPLVLAFDYAEMVELRELIAEALLMLDLYDIFAGFKYWQKFGRNGLSFDFSHFEGSTIARVCVEPSAPQLWDRAL